ncbi:glycosyl hydrolase family 79 C-terminal domain-containing protein [Streptomyces sp. SL13]|uniref:Glycosyl hydrolase family 79 C-terminal domain-containing protein n=1 Tax=Streptantibioticus silvisoli TaxID=2705255 RepID=A0AA90H263_9ACTN|nr:glycosyl hydrolase family 79 C-terminal domain-containing protein [Streptantibioticus silvisoli]MDI5968852.1 glycosyl hydrolase family 79 C-terminal domain-containing protein [Streptantibioticus silvisoli]
MKPSLSTRHFGRTRIATFAVAAAVAGATLIGSGPVHAATVAPADSASAGSLSITVHPDELGKQLNAGFVGFSFGAGTVATDSYASTDLGGYLKTLGDTGVVRVGGNSGDTTFWTSTGETAPSWATGGTITPDKLQHLATIVQDAGWKVILAVNLEHPDAARAADEAKYARQIFGDSLQAIEIGNEPNFYYSDVSAYYTDFESYVAAIEKAVPGVGITGPDAETNHSSWLGGFAALDAGNPDVSEISDHTYPASACGTSTATIPQLLGTGSTQYETANAQAALTAAAQLGVPAAMTETNSVVCAGTPGVSDAFASALWALDYSLLIAQQGIVNADFMDGTNAAGCDPYSPLCPGTGDLTAKPLYYGMLATELVGTGRFATLDNPDPADVRAYAVSDGQHLTVVLDNVQDPASNGASTVTLNLGGDFAAGQLTALTTSSSAGLAATSGITLGGQQVGPHGAFPTPQSTPVSVDGRTAKVTVPAGSAAIIRFS